jgi:hypothetical protein
MGKRLPMLPLIHRSVAARVNIPKGGLRPENLVPSAHSKEILKRAPWDGNCA